MSENLPYPLGPVATEGGHVAAVENTTRRAALLELGVRPRLASNTAGSGLGPWYLAKAKFGLLAFTLARRTREVGVRVAIGATPIRIAALFARYAGSAVAPGVLFGLAAFALARVGLMPLLFGNGARAAVPLTASMPVLLLVAVAAVALPVVRAIRIQPADALREE